MGEKGKREKGEKGVGISPVLLVPKLGCQMGSQVQLGNQKITPLPSPCTGLGEGVRASYEKPLAPSPNINNYPRIRKKVDGKCALRKLFMT
jgi:hypothetical protein